MVFESVDGGRPAPHRPAQLCRHSTDTHPIPEAFDARFNHLASWGGEGTAETARIVARIQQRHLCTGFRQGEGRAKACKPSTYDNGTLPTRCLFCLWGCAAGAAAGGARVAWSSSSRGAIWVGAVSCCRRTSGRSEEVVLPQLLPMLLMLLGCQLSERRLA